jgi:hypothetical protein
MEGGRHGGTLCRLFAALGMPETEYGACPVRSRRPTLGKYARNWSNGGYMRLNGREAVATVTVRRHIAKVAAVPLKGVRRFWGRTYPGMVVGFKGKAGAVRSIACHTVMSLYVRCLCPCLNPLGPTWKKPVGPERKRSGLTAFCPNCFMQRRQSAELFFE